MTNLGDPRLPAEFWNRVVESHPGCWLWVGPAMSNGYGKHGHDLAHRLAYAALVGPIPEGHTIDHVKARGCTSRLCVNPAHLEPVTLVENISRGSKATATHCKRGHEFTPENLTPHTGGRRRCKTCARDRARRYYDNAKTASTKG